MWSIRGQVCFLTVAFRCWCFHLLLGLASSAGCSSDLRCNETCEYNSWVQSAKCDRRNLRDIPQECCDVKILDIRWNSIITLRRGVLSNFTNLKYLYLNNNNMSLIERGVFLDSNKELELVSLSENNFQILTGDMLEGMDSVKYLLMDTVRLKGVETGALGRTPNIKTLDLRGNDLVSPPCDAVDSGNNFLSTLLLSDNNISVLPQKCFKNFSRLEQLRMSNNPIGAIANVRAFEGLSALKVLDLENTSLKEIPIAIFPLIHTIDKLILSRNLIQNLEDRDFLGLPKLKILNLEYNVIQSINERAFDGLRFLEILILSHNRIISIGNGALRPVERTLQELHLHGNRLQDIQNFSSSIPSLGMVLIADNPLACSCHLGPLRLWLTSNQDVYQSQDGNATCQVHPARGEKVPILETDLTRPCGSLTTPRMREANKKPVGTSMSSQGGTWSSSSSQGGTWLSSSTSYQPDNREHLQIEQNYFSLFVILSICGGIISICAVSLVVFFAIKKQRKSDPSSVYSEVAYVPSPVPREAPQEEGIYVTRLCQNDSMNIHSHTNTNTSSTENVPRTSVVTQGSKAFGDQRGSVRSFRDCFFFGDSKGSQDELDDSGVYTEIDPTGFTTGFSNAGKEKDHNQTRQVARMQADRKGCVHCSSSHTLNGINANKIKSTGRASLPASCDSFHSAMTISGCKKEKRPDSSFSRCPSSIAEWSRGCDKAFDRNEHRGPSRSTSKDAILVNGGDLASHSLPPWNPVHQSSPNALQHPVTIVTTV